MRISFKSANCIYFLKGKRGLPVNVMYMLKHPITIFKLVSKL